MSDGAADEDTPSAEDIPQPLADPASDEESDGSETQTSPANEGVGRDHVDQEDLSALPPQGIWMTL